MNSILTQLKIFAKENNVPILREQSGHILLQICKKNKPKNILEIGTAIGYSGILMLEGSGKTSTLTTLEKNPLRIEQAKANFQKANLQNRVTLLEGDAMTSLLSLQSQQKTFDLILLDGPKGQYIKYLPILKNLLAPKAILFADDIYLHGWVKSQEKIPHKHRAMVMALRRFIDALSVDQTLKTQFLDIEDGLSISQKI